MHYPSSENKGADQLRGHREADLRLCFCICKNPVFSSRGSYVKADMSSTIQVLATAHFTVTFFHSNCLKQGTHIISSLIC